MLPGLTPSLLAGACRTFLEHAYPAGAASVPAPRAAFAGLTDDQPLEPLLKPPLCETLRHPDGRVRGVAIRLGSATYPHVKLQAVRCDGQEACVFAVDTHDVLKLDPGHPDAAGWARLQTANRQLKERVEQAWEQAGLLTFNGLLRRGLQK